MCSWVKKLKKTFSCMPPKKNSPAPPRFFPSPLRQKEINYPQCLSKSISKVSVLLKSISPPLSRKGGREGHYEGSTKLTIGYVISSTNRFFCYKSEYLTKILWKYIEITNFSCVLFIKSRTSLIFARYKFNREFFYAVHCILMLHSFSCIVQTNDKND